MNNPIPSNDVVWSTNHVLDLKTALRLKEVLEEESEYDNVDPIKKVKQYYRSCMDEDAIEKEGLEPIQAMLDANGGWPIQWGNQESNGNRTWQEIDIIYMKKFFTGSFLEFAFIPEEEDATKNILAISQGKASYIEDEIVKRSERLFPASDVHKVVGVLKEFKKHKGIETPKENFTADVTELLTFQENLNNISEYEEQIQIGMKKVQDRMTIAELQEYYDQAGTKNPTAQINWLHLIQELLESTGKTIDSSYPVLVYNKHLLHKLAYLLDDTPEHVTDMLNDLKVEMKKRILNSKWTNDKAKNFMTEKIDNIISLIGYPSWYSNETAIIERYLGLEIGENYLKNKLDSITYENKKKLQNYMKPIDRSEWHVSPVTLNAFYAGPLNLMVIPAAEVQDPYFTPGMPLAVNYGTIGMVVGHELAHSFDTTGIEYDKVGNRITSDTETSEAFDERVKCFIDQYNNFTLVEVGEDGEPVHLNGQLTKDENVADNIGVEVAFAAFQKRKLATGPQPKLPGLTDISDEQLFFLSFANSWCIATTEDYEAASANKDDHSPNKFRILGTVANMETFSNAFNCPVDSLLNQSPKCTLWK
ncbi:Neprilysin-2 [Harpegnathos saltator]|uniref:Neprilysin-2 n=1 Tax=Harpegnathos saltator TaxID=610380 RepID=E2BAD1_HARSA|nr:Neprilysin-2 [Harpegnathos saltator]